jgi:hypothetical protein
MVELLTSTPTPCPRCGTGLVAEMFPDHRTAAETVEAADETDGDGATADGSAADVAGDRDAATSVRPPDLHATTDPAVAPPVAPPAPAADDALGDGSIRPPDLVPVMVRDEPRDVLAGWDDGVDAADLERWREDRPPFPTDAAVVLGAAAGGALLGALVGPRRGRNAVLGGLAGAVGAAVARQLWRLEP